VPDRRLPGFCAGQALFICGAEGTGRTGRTGGPGRSTSGSPPGSSTATAAIHAATGGRVIDSARCAPDAGIDSTGRPQGRENRRTHRVGRADSANRAVTRSRDRRSALHAVRAQAGIEIESRAGKREAAGAYVAPAAPVRFS